MNKVKQVCMHSYYVIALALTGLFLLLFSMHTTLASLFVKWQRDEYSHGPVIVLVALFWAWHKWAEAKTEVRASWWGVAVLIFSAAMMIAGRLSTFEPFAFYGFFLSLVGLSLAFLGKSATRVAVPAFIYLLFAVPLPALLYFGLSQKLQLVSSTLGVSILQFFGGTVFQEGNVIDLGTYKLQVVEACNGLRYLFPLMSFGYLVACLMDDALWKRIFVFLSAIPITIFMNALRIALIGWTVTVWGEVAVEGMIHDMEGWTVFVICIVLLMGEVWGLSRFGKKGGFHDKYLTLPKGRIFKNKPVIAAPVLASVAFCLLLALTMGRGMVDARAEKIPDHKPLVGIPLTLKEWTGKIETFQPKVLESLKLSDYWLADYRKDNDPVPVNFYIAYYASQRVGSTIHLPSNCIAGSGWKIDKHENKTVYFKDGKHLSLLRMKVSKGRHVQIVYYWFDQSGRSVTKQYAIKWYMLWDSLTKNRTDGSMIRLTTSVAMSEKEGDADRRIESLLDSLRVPLSRYLTDSRFLVDVSSKPQNEKRN